MNADINDLEHGKFVTSIDDPTKRGIVALNPDGSTISGGGSGVAAYSDSGDVAKKGLVDADRHVQTDVLSSALPTNAATSIKQSDGSQKTQIVDSSGNVIASTSNAMHVHIASGSSSGTQYTESDTDASITGTAIMWEDTADTLMPVSETKPLPVNIVAGSSSGTEYTEDDVAVGNPSGGMSMAVRTDALSAVTSTDGDNIALRATNKGELYVKQTDVVQVDVGSMPTTNVAQSGSWTVIADAGTDLNTSSLVTSSEFNEKIGAITETAPISDTASSGLNGRLQRIAQRITSLIALIPSALTGSGNFKVAVQEALPSGTNNIGDIDVLTVPSDPFGANADAASATGSISAKLRFIASTGIPVTGTVTVGSHAVTNAGTFAVQENGASLTSLQLIDDTVFTDDTSTHSTGSTKGLGIMAAATPTDTSVNANDIGMVAMTTDRKLHVSVQDSLPAGANAIGRLAANSGVDIGDVDVTSVSGNVTVVQATATNLKAQAEVYQGGSAVSSGNPLQVTLANGTVPSHAVTNAGTFAIQESGTHVLTDDSAFTPATTKVVMSGFEADETSTDSVDEGDGGAARMTLDRKQITTVQPHTTGGLSVFNATSSDGATALTNTAQAIKASAGQIYGWYIYNPNSSAAYVQFYNTASASVTVGTTSPLFMLTLPGSAAANVEYTNGIAFSNAGFSCAATSTAGGNGALSTALDAVIFYK